MMYGKDVPRGLNKYGKTTLNSASLLASQSFNACNLLPLKVQQENIICFLFFHDLY